MNTVNIIGRLGKDPVVNQTANGKQYIRLRVAVDSYGSNGREYTNWLNAEVWGRAGQIAKEYLRKGHLVGLSGELRSDVWESQEPKRGGKKHETVYHERTYISVSDCSGLKLLERRPEAMEATEKQPADVEF